MAQVTSPIILDSTGQQIHSDLQQIKTVLTTPSAAEDITFDNTGTGMQADDVQDAITELKSNLTYKNIATNIDLTTNIVTKTISSISGATEIYLYGKVGATYRGSLVLPYSVFSAGNAMYIPCIGGNVTGTVYVEYVSDTSIKVTTSNATFNYLDIYVK